MRQVTILIPDGWLLKFSAIILAVLFFAIFIPWWAIKLDSMRAIEQARAAAAAQEIAGKCSAQ